MPTITHTFVIHKYYPDDAEWGSVSNGLAAKSIVDVEQLGLEADLPVKEAGYSGRLLKVELDENDPRLAKLYEAIYAKYQLKPSYWTVIPKAERAHYFGLKRKVVWTEQEIDAAEFLELSSSRQIANHENPDDEQWEREDYVAEVDKKQSTAVQLGFMSPFHGLAVAEPLRSNLLAADLAGLNLTPVIFVRGGKVKKPLWALKSHVILPDTLNPIQNGRGDIVASNKGWERFESRHLDDAERDPPTLRYKRSEVETLKPFDIAMTSARFGNGREIAYRWCVVSQKFRAELKRQKVPALSYVPVSLE
ncbi:MAG: hypothetical protein WAW39_11070 [Prosthecobacter sp.]|uniref:hypothetical protein n=1 Tax=Prosthecobacter sp. TaxID=1965333 RepID=UPI003BB0A0C2